MSICFLSSFPCLIDVSTLCQVFRKMCLPFILTVFHAPFSTECNSRSNSKGIRGRKMWLFTEHFHNVMGLFHKTTLWRSDRFLTAFVCQLSLFLDLLPILAKKYYKMAPERNIIGYTYVNFIEWKSKITKIDRNRKLQKLTEIEQNWPKSIKIDRNRTKLTEISQNWPKSIKIDSNWPKLTKIDRHWLNSIKIHQLNWFVRNRFKSSTIKK